MNSKQRIFAEQWVASGDQSAAYRAAYGADGLSPRDISRKAAQVMQSKAVQAYIREIQERHAVEFDMSVQDIKKALALVIKKGLRDVATKYGQQPANLNAVVAACNELNRMNGNHAPAKARLVDEDGKDAWVSAFAAAVSAGPSDER